MRNTRISFFAEAVVVPAMQAVETVQQILGWSNRHGERIDELATAAASALQVHQALVWFAAQLPVPAGATVDS